MISIATSQMPFTGLFAMLITFASGTLSFFNISFIPSPSKEMQSFFTSLSSAPHATPYPAGTEAKNNAENRHKKREDKFFLVNAPPFLPFSSR
jgi:hypothetical protein